MSWSQRGLLIYPKDALTEPLKDAVATAYATVAGLESFVNERLMFDKAAPNSSDYGATDTHRAIESALTPELAAALRTALVGMSGLWYMLDADTGALVATNDAARLDGTTITHGLDWMPGVALSAGEVVRYEGALYEVVQAHSTLANWPPDTTRSLFKRYRAPGEITEWQQPIGSVDAYPVGALVTFSGFTWQNTIAANVWQPGVTGWTNLTPPPPTSEWAPNTAYVIDDEVTYGGVIYRCRQNHRSQVGWEPPVVLSLWLPI